MRPKPPGFDVWVKTAVEAIELLKEGNVTAISLDHDLGLDWNIEPNNGYHVAVFIEESAFNGTLKPLHVYVHSQNAVGRERIRQALLNARKFWMNNKGN